MKPDADASREVKANRSPRSRYTLEQLFGGTSPEEWRRLYRDA